MICKRIVWNILNKPVTQLNSSIWPIVEILTGTTTLGQSGPGSNVNEGVIHIPQSSKTGALPSYAV